MLAPSERRLVLPPDDVLAVLAGRKTQHRLLFFCDNAGACGGGSIEYGRRGRGFAAWEGDLDTDGWPLRFRLGSSTPEREPSPVGEAGQRLWIAEPWCQWRNDAVIYQANHHPSELLPPPFRWRSATQMQRRDSRIDLEVAAVRCEQLQAITLAGIEAEGLVVPAVDYSVADDPRTLDFEREAEARRMFRERWDDRHERAPWKSNPWVWVATFRVLAVRGAAQASQAAAVPPPGTEAFTVWARRQREALKAAGWRRERTGSRELWVRPPPWPNGQRPPGMPLTVAARKLALRQHVQPHDIACGSARLMPEFAVFGRAEKRLGREARS